MVLVSKEEKEDIVHKFPDVCVVRTMKGDSGRHKYYIEERRDIMRFLMKKRSDSTMTSVEIKSGER